jgi:Na+/proline symporter
MLSIGAGTGLVYLLRWFWWRINAWTEVSAMASSFLVACVFFVLSKYGHAVDDNVALLVTVGVTTVVWIAVTYLTPAVDQETLDAFYRKVRPAGPGWERVRRRTGAPASPDSLPQSLLGWVLGLASIYSALFGTGAYLYGHWIQAIVYTVVFLVSVISLIRLTSISWGAKAAPAEAPA